jgi:hypothetical protein
LHDRAGVGYECSIRGRKKRNSWGEMQMSLRSLTILLSISVLASGAGIAHAQSASTTAKQALSAFPCPSGDSSCGNGDSPAPKKPHKRKHHKSENSTEVKNTETDSNPNQKIETAPPNDPQYSDPGPEQ